jgi:hypothetical protein
VAENRQTFVPKRAKYGEKIIIRSSTVVHEIKDQAVKGNGE